MGEITETFIKLYKNRFNKDDLDTAKIKTIMGDKIKEQLQKGVELDELEKNNNLSLQNDKIRELDAIREKNSNMKDYSISEYFPDVLFDEVLSIEERFDYYDEDENMKDPKIKSAPADNVDKDGEVKTPKYQSIVSVVCNASGTLRREIRVSFTKCHSWIYDDIISLVEGEIRGVSPWKLLTDEKYGADYCKFVSISTQHRTKIPLNNWKIGIRIWMLICVNLY